MSTFDQYCNYTLINSTFHNALNEKYHYTSIPWSWYINFNLCRIFLLLVYFLVIFSPIYIVVSICLHIKSYHDINAKINLTSTLIQDLQKSIQNL
jgi:hypothetical protein